MPFKPFQEGVHDLEKPGTMGAQSNWVCFLVWRALSGMAVKGTRKRLMSHVADQMVIATKLGNEDAVRILPTRPSAGGSLGLRLRNLTCI